LKGATVKLLKSKPKLALVKKEKVLSNKKVLPSKKLENTDVKYIYSGEIIKCYSTEDFVYFDVMGLKIPIPKNYWEYFKKEISEINITDSIESNIQNLKTQMELELSIGSSLYTYSLQSVDQPKKVIKLLSRKLHNVTDEEVVISHFKKHGVECLVLWDYELDNPLSVAAKWKYFMKFGNIVQA
jgi:hypothetical protein